jgi:hypothetical protein
VRDWQQESDVHVDLIQLPRMIHWQYSGKGISQSLSIDFTNFQRPTGFESGFGSSWQVGFC